MTVYAVPCPTCGFKKARLEGEPEEDSYTLRCLNVNPHEFTVDAVPVDVRGGTTEHGENIAGEIQSEDAYGAFDQLTAADVWLILDNLHSHFVTPRTCAGCWKAGWAN